MQHLVYRHKMPRRRNRRRGARAGTITESAQAGLLTTLGAQVDLPAKKFIEFRTFRLSRLHVQLATVGKPGSVVAEVTVRNPLNDRPVWNSGPMLVGPSPRSAVRSFTAADCPWVDSTGAGGNLLSIAVLNTQATAAPQLHWVAKAYLLTREDSETGAQITVV